jgi:hypothetical protein
MLQTTTVYSSTTISTEDVNRAMPYVYNRDGAVISVITLWVKLQNNCGSNPGKINHLSLSLQITKLSQSRHTEWNALVRKCDTIKSRATVSTGSVTAVCCGPKKNGK